MDDAAYRLSRVYAEGWNAAHKLSSNDSDDLDLRRVAALNLYAARPERTRWSEGFSKRRFGIRRGSLNRGLYRNLAQIVAGR